MTRPSLRPGEVEYQTGYVQRLWGAGAPMIVRRYIADCAQLGNASGVTFWTKVLNRVSTPRASP